MRISIILCTHNRSRILPKVLESLAASRIPESVEWEVLLVDNNSRDQTRQVAEDFCRRHSGRFRYLFEPHPGKSYALNSGIREARGEILAFTDDDVTVHPMWLQNLVGALDDEKWAGVGGRTLLAQTFAPPRWLALHGPYGMGGILAALFDLGETPCELDRAPYGVNMAFRREVFSKYGNFRVDLGRRPGSLLSNEDTEFGRRLMAAGQRLRYEPSAIVYHPVVEERLRRRYFLTWWFLYGRAGVRETKRQPDILGLPRYCFTIPKMIFTIFAARAMKWLVALDPQWRFYCKTQVWMTVGQMVEFCQRAHQVE